MAVSCIATWPCQGGGQWAYRDVAGKGGEHALAHLLVDHVVFYQQHTQPLESLATCATGVAATQRIRVRHREVLERGRLLAFHRRQAEPTAARNNKNFRVELNHRFREVK